MRVAAEGAKARMAKSENGENGRLIPKEQHRTGKKCRADLGHGKTQGVVAKRAKVVTGDTLSIAALAAKTGTNVAKSASDFD